MECNFTRNPFSVFHFLLCKDKTITGKPVQLYSECEKWKERQTSEKNGMYTKKKCL